MVLISTPGSPDANSFVDFLRADMLLREGWTRIDAWLAKTQAEAEAGLIQSTTILNAAVDFNGYASTSTQALRVPRIGLYDRDGYEFASDSIPLLLEQATALQTLRMFEQNRISEPGLLGKGIREVSAGPVTIKADQLSLLDLIPLEVRLLLSVIGTIRPEASKQGGVSRLTRG